MKFKKWRYSWKNVWVGSVDGMEFFKIIINSFLFRDPFKAVYQVINAI